MNLAAACDLEDVVPGATASPGAYRSTDAVALSEAIDPADEALYREQRGRRSPADTASDDQLAVDSAK